MTQQHPEFTGPQHDVQETLARAQSEGAVVLDVREDDEWAAGHAPDATHIPLGELPTRVGELDRDLPVLAMCRSGNRSRTAAAQLAAAGFDVANVVGGMKAWHSAGLPTVTNSGAPGTVD